MNDFWSRKLGQQQPPPHVPAPVTVAPQQPGQTAWWMTPASTPQQQMPLGDSAVQSIQYSYQQLKGMRADQMNQDQMEALATIELQLDKYNQVCDQCGSTNFLPAGSKVGSFRMPTNKCFECGNSARSPEPAQSGKAGRQSQHTRQLDGGRGSYGQHHSQLPANMAPRA